jgi:hypothetical protein
MLNYKQIGIVKGPAAEAIQKAIKEDRALNFKFVKENNEEVAIIVGAEITGSESVNKEELVEEEELLIVIR